MFDRPSPAPAEMDFCMKTQLESARDGILTPEMRQVAGAEYLAPEFIRDEIAAGRLVIPANPAHTHLKPIGIGRKLRTKINANIGNSSLSSDEGQELA